MKKKVLHVINSMSPAGAEVLLANSLSQGGLCEYTENHLAFFTSPSYLLNKLDKNVQVHFLDYKGGPYVIKLLWQLRKIIKDNHIDIVHSHLNPADLYIHFVCPKNVSHVHTVHTAYSMDVTSSKFKLWTEKYLYLVKKNANIIFLSNFTKDDFLKSVHFKGKAFVLNNFVSDNFFNNKKHQPAGVKNCFKLVAVGRLAPVKNLEYLLDVFTYLKELNIQLDIYGSGDIGKYEKEIAGKNINVKMMGHSDNMAEVLQQYDALIMPSKYEGFGLALFEAMAAGLPVLLSNIVPFKSTVKDNAIYFDLNKPAETAEIIRSVFYKNIDLNQLVQKASLFANETVRRDKYIKKLLSIYDDILR